MPQSRRKDRWEHPTYKLAYVREYKGNACTVIHGSNPISTGFKWKPSSKTAALKVLEQRLHKHLNGGVPVVSDTSMTCGELFEQFGQVRFPNIERHTRLAYVRAFEVIPPKTGVNETARLMRYIREGFAERNYQQNTLHKSYKWIRTVFAFGIERGWVKVNPVNTDMIPHAVIGKATPYTRAEINYAISQLKPQFKAAIMFLASTGCRPKEMVRLSWHEVYEDHVVLVSWKGRKHVMEPRTRIVPFALCPEAGLAIEMCRNNRIDDRENRGKKGMWATKKSPFGFNSFSGLAKAFNKAIAAFGGEPRGLYDLRFYAINNWKKQGYPENLRNLLAGHEAKVARTVYETPPTVQELEGMRKASGA